MFFVLVINLNFLFGRSPRHDAGNPGNNLFVTGLSTRTTESDLEDYFAKEGKVIRVQSVIHTLALLNVCVICDLRSPKYKRCMHAT